MVICNPERAPHWAPYLPALALGLPNLQNREKKVVPSMVYLSQWPTDEEAPNKWIQILICKGGDPRRQLIMEGDASHQGCAALN